MNKFTTFSLDSFDFKDQESPVDQMQRTLEWLQKRSGCYTGSKITDLMSCDRATAKQPWGALEKMVGFGDKALTYIYIVGHQRTTDVLEMEISSKPTDWGTENESLLIDRLVKDGIITNFQEKGFEYFGDYERGGASVDGICDYKGEEVALELKCCVTWSGHKSRMYEPIHDKHKDFWQHQAEMLATGKDKLLYVVAEPMQVEKYSIQIVKASEVHQKALLARCRIADDAILLWDDYPYTEALKVACSLYKEDNEI